MLATVECECTSKLAHFLPVPILLKPNPSSSVPIYVQLKDQIRHAVEIGLLRPGEPLPPLRTLAEQLVINANTVARVYRELEQEGLLVLRQGVGAFVSEFGSAIELATSRTARLNDAQQAVHGLVEQLRTDGLTVEEIRRLVEAKLGDDWASSATRRTERVPAPMPATSRRKD